MPQLKLLKDISKKKIADPCEKSSFDHH